MLSCFSEEAVGPLQDDQTCINQLTGHVTATSCDFFEKNCRKLAVKTRQFVTFKTLFCLYGSSK